MSDGEGMLFVAHGTHTPERITTLPTPRERSIVNPTLISGAVFFPTFIPNSDLCVAEGTSNLASESD